MKKNRLIHYASLILSASLLIPAAALAAGGPGIHGYARHGQTGRIRSRIEKRMARREQRMHATNPCRHAQSAEASMHCHLSRHQRHRGINRRGRMHRRHGMRHMRRHRHMRPGVRR